MFEKHQAKKAAEEHQRQPATWQGQVESTGQLLATATGFAGEATTQIMLKRGEAVFASISGASLVEDRRGSGHWEGRSSGVSIPVGSIGGHAVRYHAGASKGHYVQAAPVATAIDTGTMFITNQRVIFQGGRQTRECLFAKLVGYQHAARKHGVTDDDMRHAITHRLHVSEIPTDDDSERVLVLGPDRAGTRSSWSRCSSTMAPWWSTPCRFEPATALFSKESHDDDSQPRPNQQRRTHHR